MQGDIPGKVLGVTGRTTRNGKTVYDVKFSDGNDWTTFNGELAAKANGFAQSGQDVTARVEVTDKGYKNLLEVAPAGSLIPTAGTAIPMGAPVGGIGAGSIPINTSPGAGSRGMDPAREAKIIKQNVLGTAHAFVGQLFQGAGPEAFEQASALALEYAKVLGNAVVGGAQATPVIPAAQTPEAVATAVNEVAGQTLVGVGAPAETPAAEGATIQW